ncbi:MAG: sulfatase [Planctomycetota bacterium]|nr:sulfatase [Planctomycetota bacterium]
MNVIVICCDTLRADILDHTWRDAVHTPNLDTLRQMSSVFTNAWAEGLPTVPMRRNMYTGMRSYPWRYTIDDRGSTPNLHGWHAMPTGHTTVAERLVPQGVMTGWVGDLYHLHKPTMNFMRGFLGYDFIRGQESDSQRTGPLSKIDMAKHLPDEIATPEARPGMAKYLLNMLDRQSEEDYLAAKVFRSAARWIQDNLENRPFYLHIESFTPHEHWDPPTYFADQYFIPDPADDVRDFIYPQMVQGFRKLTELEIERTKALYYGYITFLDKWIGYFLTLLNDLKLWDDTTIVLLSDHGTELMDKTQFGKSPRAMHPYNTRLNFWVRHPEESLNGQQIGELVQSVDVAPTLLSLFGVEHEQLHGYDLIPLLKGDVGLRNEVMTAWGQFAAVRDERWNLIVNTMREDPDTRLYNTRKDPDETTNVADANPSIVKHLRGKLESFLGEELPVRYAHQPTSDHTVGFGDWAHSNLSK